MATSPILSATVLGKRKADDFVLHLSSSSSHAPTDSEAEAPLATRKGASQGHSIDPGYGSLSVTTGRREKRYKCAFTGCDKAYTKPVRLAEHERSHTGIRPFVCESCQKSYLRETHLQAHTRSHQPESARPLVCSSQDCSKRFWTKQHLEAHEKLHRGEKPFKCSEEQCGEVFAKHNQLRRHACEKHAPPGTKPYRCTHEGCTRSFATNQHLRSHIKSHDEKRYTCVYPQCLPARGEEPIFYPTWTALQHHSRTAHPPICPHPSCGGRTFTTQRSLRAHNKLHDQRNAEEQLQQTEISSDADDEHDAAERPRKRRRGGELGRDWICDVDECRKDFKSRQALYTHNKVKHLGLREFKCPYAECPMDFGYKKLLRRHIAKVHEQHYSAAEDNGSACGTDTDGAGPSSDEYRGRFNVASITGAAYASRNLRARVRCPYPNLSTFATSGVPGDGLETAALPRCDYVFSRAYDLRRHLHAEHRLHMSKEDADAWILHVSQVL